MTSLVESPRQALANMSTSTYLATLSDMAWLGDPGEVALADPQDGRRVVGAGDLPAEDRLVVVPVGPAEHVLEHRLLVEPPAEIDGLGRLVGVDQHGLAVTVDLAAAVRPEER